MTHQQNQTNESGPLKLPPPPETARTLIDMQSRDWLRWIGGLLSATNQEDGNDL